MQVSADNFKAQEVNDNGEKQDTSDPQREAAAHDLSETAGSSGDAESDRGVEEFLRLVSYRWAPGGV